MITKIHQHLLNLQHEERQYYNNADLCNFTYLELLQMKEWKVLRRQILERDGNTCSKCTKYETLRKWNNDKRDWSNYDVVFPKQIRKHLNYYCQNGTTKSYYILDDTQFVFIETDVARNLHVHHKYYIKERFPWQYSEECFETLCLHCHFTLHEQSVVPVFVHIDKHLLECKNVTPCLRCNGAGFFPDLRHVQEGICFRCWGVKYEQLITDQYRKKSSDYYKSWKRDGSSK